MPPAVAPLLSDTDNARHEQLSVQSETPPQMGARTHSAPESIQSYRDDEASASLGPRPAERLLHNDEPIRAAPPGRGLARSATTALTTGHRRLVRAATSIAERSGRHVPVQLHDLTSRKPDVVALLMLVGYMLLGTVYFHLTLGWTWIDAMYFSFTTTLTVGYGDFNPEQSSGHTPAEMVCTILYVAQSNLQAALCRNVASCAGCRYRYVIVGVGLIGACLIA
jgi:hypothetical protein